MKTWWTMHENEKNLGGPTPQWFHRMDEQGETPFSRALKSSYPLLVELLLAQEEEYRKVAEGRSENSAPDDMAYWGFGKKLDKLLDEDAFVFSVDSDGNTPLMKAVCGGDKTMVHTLLDSGSPVDSVNKKGLRPLHWACLSGRTDMAQLLLDQGAQINPEVAEGWEPSPTSTALLMGYNELYDLLVCRGGKLR
jgi:ankyrin repeat protein